jgi:hypothetical protein
MNKKGLAPIITLLILGGIILLGGSWYLVQYKQKKPIVSPSINQDNLGQDQLPKNLDVHKDPNMPDKEVVSLSSSANTIPESLSKLGKELTIQQIYLAKGGSTYGNYYRLYSSGSSTLSWGGEGCSGGLEVKKFTLEEISELFDKTTNQFDKLNNSPEMEYSEEEGFKIEISGSLASESENQKSFVLSKNCLASNCNGEFSGLVKFIHDFWTKKGQVLEHKKCS